MSSSSYWQRREKKWQEECQEKDKDWQKEIEEVYQTMADEISEQIAVFYQKFADKNGMTMAQAKQYLDRTDIEYYSRLAERYCKEAARDMASGSYSQDASKEYFTEQANKEMARYNTAMKISRLEMIKHQINLRIAKAQGKVMSAAEKALSERAMETYTRQAGILGDTVLNNAKNIDTIVHASFHGQNFSERIWGKQQDNMKKVLTKALQDCLVLGKGAAPFVRELAKETGVTTRQAQRLISTELSRVQNQAALDSMVAGGFEEFQVVSSPDCCEECQAINGEHFPIPKLATGTNAPPMHPNCRCSIAPFEARDEDDDDFDEASFDEWCDYMEKHEDDPNAMTWEEWKDKEKRIVAQKSRGTKVKITDQAPSKVKVIEPEGYTKEIAIKSREVREQLLIHARDQNDSNECVGLINLVSGERSNWVDGSQDSVDVEGDAEAYHLLISSPPRSLELTHNHPGQSYFSLNDLNVFMSWPSIKCMTIVTNQGKTWYLNKTENFDYKKLSNIMRRHIKSGLTGDDLVKAFVKDGIRAGLERG